MNGLPPGSILQLMYIKNRVSKLRLTSFVEIGSGNGYLSKVLLGIGLSGTGYDLNSSACLNNSILNAKFIQNGRYEVLNEDFLQTQAISTVDLIISSMVIEHLSLEQIDTYINKAKEYLNPGGKLIFLVPAHKKYWSIEDDVAGHLRRYDELMIKDFAKSYNLQLAHSKGLTFPVSNILLPLSNYIINKNEKQKLRLNQWDRTINSGNRGVKFKTNFPFLFKFILNPVFLFPFYLLQKLKASDKYSLVYYFEFLPDR